MKLFCNGFNAYKQLGELDLVLKNFTICFESEDIKCFLINHSYSLLQNKQEVVIYPQKHQKLAYENKDIVKVVSNNDRILVLDSSGKILKFDLNNFKDPCIIPNLPDLDESEKIQNISCGSKISIAYSNEGTLFNIPEKLNFKNSELIDIQCGREHCLLLDRIGNVYSFGRGSRGQLGHGDLDDQPEPLLVCALAGLKILQISTGGWHSCALSQDGDVYVWGWNSNGQLGLAKIEDDVHKCVSVMATPHIVDVLHNEINVKRIAAGNRHTIILLDNNHLFGCGWNKYKQLKHEDKENIYSFIYLHDFSNEEILDIKCGPWNSAVLCK